MASTHRKLATAQKTVLRVGDPGDGSACPVGGRVAAISSFPLDTAVRTFALRVTAEAV